ncbi:recombinase family protein [Curtobacterium sp. MCSS17_011]|uniref:recombinase family protein n=1 Tax=Curtobacterium sp. MCSS17_011 TaxID=2175643 RepID=UPI000D8C8824|nr:recombinase family protein [Curtobacterium sp. MCSS17_011]PYY61401.1 recombinase family protein [Curtobacterium sp. MCSS17_011]
MLRPTPEPRPATTCRSHPAADADAVRVAPTDRLARSLGDLRDLVDEITTKGASVEFLKEQQADSRDTDDAIGRLMLNLLRAFAEFERISIRERQRQRIRIAKAAGKYKGRTRRPNNDQVTEAHRLIGTGVPKVIVARNLGIDRTTLQRMLGRPAPRSPTGDEHTVKHREPCSV